MQKLLTGCVPANQIFITISFAVCALVGGLQISILQKENWKEGRDDVGVLTVGLVDVGITTV